jgi:hypothetical protein
MILDSFLIKYNFNNLEYFDILLNLGINLRYEAPLICTRVRKCFCPKMYIFIRSV